MPHPILLYDGVCGLCNRLVQFILRRDADAVFQFASLQSPLARQILTRHGADAGDLDTVYVVVNYDLPDENLLPRSDAVIFILRHLGAAELRSARPGLRPEPTESKATKPRGLIFWRFAGSVLLLIPRPLRDWGYRVVARNRYRVFGRSETCILPAPETSIPSFSQEQR
jgi:predicted DCC family thiol-disulfide oxidoreductase YuxK